MTWAPPPTERRTGMAYGGTFERVVAYFVDGLVLTLIGALIYVPAAMAGIGPFANLGAVYSMSYGAGDGTFPLSTVVPDAGAVAVLLGMALISAAISAAYFVLQWSGPSRATLGMRLLHLQIGDAADGRTITRGQAFKRWLALGGWTGVLSAFPPISGVVSLALLAWELALLITTATSTTKQGLHDQFAGTAIVAPSGSSGNGVVIGCALIIAAIVVIFVISFVALLFLGSQVSGILSTIGESV